MNSDVRRLGIDSSKKSYSSTLTLLIFMIQFIGLFLLAVKVNEQFNIKFMILTVSFIVVSLLSNIYLPKITQGDNALVFIVNMLYTIGLMMIIRLNVDRGMQHIIWYLLSMAVAMVIYAILSKWMYIFKNKFIFYFIVTLATFIVTLTLGRATGGAKNWIKLPGDITIQLSEFAKISFIFMIASFYGDYDNISSEKLGKYYLNIATYIFIALFFLQGELGTAMVFFAVFLFSSFVYEKNYKLLFINIILAVIGLFVAYKMFDHIKVRFDIWLDPWADYKTKGYQIIQGLFAISSGGLFGSGLGLGSPNLIPVASSDFIVPAIIEEMGIFMGISVVLLFVILIYKGIKIALVNQDVFFSSLAFGTSIVFAAQAIVMFGGVLKLIPLTGITTPFMSYGGSATLSSFILLMVLQFTSSERRHQYEKF